MIIDEQENDKDEDEGEYGDDDLEPDNYEVGDAQETDCDEDDGDDRHDPEPVSEEEVDAQERAGD